MKQSNRSPHVFTTFLSSRRKRVDRLLDRYLVERKDDNLATAMRYAVLNGGKRLRPLLVYTVGEAYGADLKTLDIPACAIEIIHSFSLVHDDLPAMDNDDLRRGKLTCHKAFGEATAILAGDALSVFAFQLISEAKTLEPQQALVMSKELALASGLGGMASGQDMDVHVVGKKLSASQQAQMYLLKTGALLKAAIKLGAIAANVNDKKELHLLDVIAKKIGLAFQIQDDIFDIESSAQKLGKSVGVDKNRNKTTYPVLVGIHKAKAKVRSLWRDVAKAVVQLQVSALTLTTLIDYIKRREY